MNFAVGTASSMALGTTASAAAGTIEHRKLVDAAQQFEGMLMQEMLKPMREHGFCQDENEDKQEGSGFADTLSSFGTESVATTIAKGGGLGIARRVVAEVEGQKVSRSGSSQLAQAAQSCSRTGGFEVTNVRPVVADTVMETEVLGP